MMIKKVIRIHFHDDTRFADRFHVFGYVIESMQAVCKTTQSTLSPTH